MKWRVRKPGAYFRALLRWHHWFAWYPVRIPSKGPMSNMTKVWLETIERRHGQWKRHGDFYGFSWEYRWIKKGAR